MRRSLLVALAAVAALSASGCGESSSSALEQSLGALPKDAAFVVTIDTDLEGDQFKALEKKLERFPFTDQLRRGLLDSVREGDLDYEKDIKPVLGNEIVVGAPSAKVFLADSDRVVAAFKSEDDEKLRELIEKDGGAKKVGESEGADIFEDDGFTAVENGFVIVAQTREDLDAALKRADGDEGLTEEDLTESLGELPEEALVKLHVDLESLLAAPEAAEARKIKWIGALRSFGLTASASDDGIALDYAVTTDPEGLTDEDLPIAAGDEAPELVVRGDEAATGLRDLSQIVEFAQRAGEAVDPEGYEKYAAEKAKLGEDLDIDIDRDVIAQFSGDMAVSQTNDNKGFAVRAELTDATAFEATLEKIADNLPKATRARGGGPLGVSKPKGDEDLYAISEAGGGDRVALGVVDGVFVAASDPERAAEIATASPTEVKDLSGALVSTADAGAIANALVTQFSGADAGNAASLFTGALGDITSYLKADTSGLRGAFKLEIE